MKNQAIDLADRIMLPRKQRDILLALADAKTFLSTDKIIDHVYRDDPDGGPLDARAVLYTHMLRLRKAVTPHGVSIIASRHLGYRLKMPLQMEADHG